jgi:hypothetical protein
MAALAAGLILTATPAPAANYDLITMAELRAVLQSAGLSVGSTSSAEVLSVGGSGSYVWITDCGPEGRCAEISIFRNYGNVRPTLQKVNEWNNSKKVPEASLNDDGTLHMEMWLSTVGSTDTNIVDMFNWFERYAADTAFWRPYTS